MTGSVSNKKDLTISIDDFNKQYKFWLFQQQIPDDTASEVTEKCAAQRSTIINGLIDEKIILDQAEKLGVTLSEEDQALFRQLMAGTRKIKQDTIVHRPQRKKISEVPVKRLIQEQADASHYFSDEFQPLLNTEGPVKYVRPDVSHFEAKKLRRGDYSPELFLDLHGLTQLQAKQELGALIAACRREHVFCACVMHGHGKHILKQQTPLWLAQHPHVMAFHQAPKEYGGDAALLVLIEVEEWLPPELP